MKRRPPTGSASLPSTVFYRIEETPLDRFVRLVCDDELTALVKNPGDHVAPEVLAEAAFQLSLEYVDANGNNEARYKIELIREEALLTLREARLEAAVSVLPLFGVYPATPGFADLLAAIREIPGFEDVELDPTAESYTDDVAEFTARTREVSIDAKLKRLEIEELLEAEARKDAPVKLTRKYFLTQLGRIATFRRVAVVRIQELTVAEYCAAFHEVLEAQNAPKV